MGIAKMIAPSRILIVRTDRLGDVVLTLPLAVELKRLFPGSSITFLAREYTALMPELCEAVNEVLLLPTDIKNELPEMLRSRRFDVAFIVSPSFALAQACRSAAIPIRIGTAYRWYSPFFFTQRVRDHRKHVRFHELEYNLRMLRPLEIECAPRPENVNYGLRIPEEMLSSALVRLKDFTRPNSRILILHPGSGGSSVDLPIEKFREIAASLSAEKDCTLLITGGSTEEGICSKVAAGLPVKNLAGKLTLKELVGIIKKSDIFVSNSTGPLHIAAALGVPAVGFYPRIPVCSAKRWGPYGKNTRVFEPAQECDNCTRARCKKTQCMQTIDASLVADYSRKILKQEMK